MPLKYLVLDIETAPRPDADTDAAYAAEGREPPSNYKSEDAIARWRERDRASWRETLGLSPATGRVVATGTQFVEVSPDGYVPVVADHGIEPRLRHAGDLSEWHLLDYLMTDIRVALREGAAVATFNGKAFDLPYIALRCAALDIPLGYPPESLHRKYNTAKHIDLYETITGGGTTRFSGHSLASVARTWQLAHQPVGHGSEVAAQVAAGDWASVEAHLRSDVNTTTALLVRLTRVGWL
jgi:hypothetical protein